MMRIWKTAAIAITAASLLTAAALPAATAVAAGRAAQAKVPWSKVGPGWVLDEYTVTFPKAGHYAFHCAYHQSAGMVGVFVVA